MKNKSDKSDKEDNKVIIDYRNKLFECTLANYDLDKLDDFKNNFPSFIENKLNDIEINKHLLSLLSNSVKIAANAQIIDLEKQKNAKTESIHSFENKTKADIFELNKKIEQLSLELTKINEDKNKLLLKKKGVFKNEYSK